MEQYQPRKITIIGSGNIGSALLETLHHQYPQDKIVVYNRDSPRGTAAAISEDQREGIARQLRRGNPGRKAASFDFLREDMKAAMKGADIVVITAGKPRKSPTQPRSDLAKDNIQVIDEVAQVAAQLAQESQRKPTFIIATNPIGLIDQRFQETSGIPHEQIMGLSGELDVERLRQSIRMHLNVDYDDIKGARVIGDHGPGMVPILSQIEVRKDEQWKKLLDLPEVHAQDGKILKEFKAAAVSGGGKFSKWTEQSDFRGPAAALAYMIEQVYDARFGDISKSLPITASTYHAESGLYTGQTITFDREGKHHVAHMPPLSAEEQADFAKSLALQADDRAKFETLTRHVSHEEGHARGTAG